MLKEHNISRRESNPERPRDNQVLYHVATTTGVILIQYKGIIYLLPVTAFF